MIRDWVLHNQLILVQPLLRRDDVELTLLDTEAAQDAVLHTIQVKFGEGEPFELEILATGSASTLISVSGKMMHVDGRSGTFVANFSMRPETRAGPENSSSDIMEASSLPRTKIARL